jgi:aerobic carbon-monoxide dehydrogenase small subunit
MSYRFSVNREPVELDVPGMRRLLDVLREDLSLTGTKEGCGEGECGACSVIVDGQIVDSCLVPVCQVEGADVRTVEGLSGDGQMDPLQNAFLQAGGAPISMTAAHRPTRTFAKPLPATCAAARATPRSSKR